LDNYDPANPVYKNYTNQQLWDMKYVIAGNVIFENPSTL
jgi:hypothetical protein